MGRAEDAEQLQIIQKAARTVGESLDWADHGGGEEAWDLIRRQPAVVRTAYAALSATVRGRISGELLDNFARFPEHYWHRLEDAVLAQLSTDG